jgi:ubiquinone/menaquinone biosynthesis C-methylase UbiE
VTRSSSQKKKLSGIAPGYLHGFSAEEQSRLYRQARFLESSVYPQIDFSQQRNLIEVGCGVGAQTEILLERFPKLRISGIDSSSTQITRAKKHLTQATREGRVEFRVADALHLPYPDNHFDAAFVCWFLEHVQTPVEILKEIRRVLTSGGILYCSEVLNNSLYLHPYSPATLQYWFAYNDHQWTLKGDPFVGAKLGNYLSAAGFQNIVTQVKVEFYDNRTPKRRADFLEYWTSLLLSGASGLIEAGKVTPDLVDAMTRELRKLKDEPDSVFFYSWVQAHAQVF